MITQTYESPTLKLYKLTIDNDAHELRNRMIAYGYAHNHPDDAYLLGRNLLSAMLNNLSEIDLDDQEFALIQRVNTWADHVIARYRIEHASEIAEYETLERTTLSDAETFRYATA